MNLCGSFVELEGIARTPWTASDSWVLCSHSQPPQQCLLALPSPTSWPSSWQPDAGSKGRPTARTLGSGEGGPLSRLPKVLSVQPALRSLTRQQPALHCSPLPTAVNHHKLGAFKDTDLSPYSSEGQMFKISPSELKARLWKGCVPSGGPGETLLPLLLQLLEAHEFTGWCITSSPLTPTLLHPSYEDP